MILRRALGVASLARVPNRRLGLPPTTFSWPRPPDPANSNRLSGGPDAPGHRAGLAVEPMTCAPDAFNDDSYPFDTGLGVIAPGDAHKASWRIAAVS